MKLTLDGGMKLTLDGQMARAYLFPSVATVSVPASAIWQADSRTVDTRNQNPNGDPQEVSFVAQLRVSAQASASRPPPIRRPPRSSRSTGTDHREVSANRHFAPSRASRRFCCSASPIRLFRRRFRNAFPSDHLDNHHLSGEFRNRPTSAGHPAERRGRSVVPCGGIPQHVQPNTRHHEMEATIGSVPQEAALDQPSSGPRRAGALHWHLGLRMLRSRTGLVRRHPATHGIVR